MRIVGEKTELQAGLGAFALGRMVEPELIESADDLSLGRFQSRPTLPVAWGLEIWDHGREFACAAETSGARGAHPIATYLLAIDAGMRRPIGR